MDFVIIDFKGEPPVARNRNTPRSGAITGKLMDPPAGRTLQPCDILDALQCARPRLPGEGRDPFLPWAPAFAGVAGI
jgi:hypothetical protein